MESEFLSVSANESPRERFRLTSARGYWAGLFSALFIMTERVLECVDLHRCNNLQSKKAVSIHVDGCVLIYPCQVVGSVRAGQRVATVTARISRSLWIAIKNEIKGCESQSEDTG